MEIIKRGENVPPDFFITDCRKNDGSGCGATLKVYAIDCFKCPFVGGENYLSFYCEQCGLILTPDNTSQKPNVPPWNPFNFPTWKEFNLGIKWGIR